MKRVLYSTGAAAVCIGVLAGCGSDDDNAAEAGWDIHKAPEEVTWASSVGCLALPVSEVSGPYETSGVVPRGYEHSPQGAVMAAVVGQGWLAAAGDDQWTQVSSQLVAPGPGRDQWAQARALMSVEGCMEHPPEFMGFAFDEMSDSSASLVLAVKNPDGSLYAMPTQVSWQDDDWRVVLPAQDQAVDAVELENLDSFVLFGQEGSSS